MQRVLAVALVVAAWVCGGDAAAVAARTGRRLTCPISKKGYHEYRVAGYELLALKRSAEAKRCFEEAMMLYLTRIGNYHSAVRPGDVSPAAMQRADALTRSVKKSMGLDSTIDTGAGRGGSAAAMNGAPAVGPAQYPGAGAAFDAIADADAAKQRAADAAAGTAADTAAAPAPAPGPTPHPLEGIAPRDMPVPLTSDTAPPSASDAMRRTLQLLRERRRSDDARAARDARDRRRGVPSPQPQPRVDVLTLPFWHDEVQRAEVASDYDRQLQQQRAAFDE